MKERTITSERAVETESTETKERPIKAKEAGRSAGRHVARCEACGAPASALGVRCNAGTADEEFLDFCWSCYEALRGAAPHPPVVEHLEAALALLTLSPMNARIHIVRALQALGQDREKYVVREGELR